MDYADGLRIMEAAAERVRGGGPDHLFLLEHPHVVTVGRRGGWSNLLAPPALLDRLGVDRFETDRGGDVTYHGPGQLVGYPVVALREGPGGTPGERDVRRYVEAVEDLVIAALSDFGIGGAQRGARGKEGVWVDGAKVAAVGVRIDRWVTTHGFALNVTTDLDKFGLIVPCGLPDPVTSVERLLAARRPGSPPPAMAEVRARIAHHAARLLGRRLAAPAGAPLPVERQSVQVVVGLPPPADAWLVLTRTPERGGFDQPVTGLVDPSDLGPREAAAREVAEETGLAVAPADLIDLAYVHDFLVEAWTRPGNPDPADTLTFCREHTFAWRAPADAPARLRLSPREHVSARWLPAAQAEAAVRWSGNRRALRLASRA